MYKMTHRKKQFTIYAYASCQKPNSRRNSNTELEAVRVTSFRFFDEQSSSERDLMMKLLLKRRKTIHGSG